MKGLRLAEQTLGQLCLALALPLLHDICLADDGRTWGTQGDDGQGHLRHEKPLTSLSWGQNKSIPLPPV